MLHVATIGLSCLLLVGTLTAPCTIRTDDEADVLYGETPIVYDDRESDEYNLLASSMKRASIPYNWRQFGQHDLAIFCPTYTFAPTVGACAPIAAANVVGFYDRYDENLIPNHPSGRLVGEWYSYYGEDSAVVSVIRELYDLMGTTTSGTTEDEFLDGLERFCKNKGKTLETQSCMSESGGFSFAKAQSYIMDSNMPIVFFLSGYNVGNIAANDHEDTFCYYQYDANHVMVGFGCAVYVYQILDGSLLTKIYFNVAAGMIEHSSGLYDISLDTKINDALAVRIY